MAINNFEMINEHEINVNYDKDKTFSIKKSTATKKAWLSVLYKLAQAGPQSINNGMEDFLLTCELSGGSDLLQELIKFNWIEADSFLKWFPGDCQKGYQEWLESQQD